MIDNLEIEYLKIRDILIKICLEASGGHIGGSLSCLHILVYLYYSEMLDDDTFIMSKGHCCPALYAIYRSKGMYLNSIMKSFNSAFQGHPDVRYIPELKVSTGSLGQGLSMAIGMALAKKLKGNTGRIFVLLGDGECQEGQVWEAINFMAHNGLENIVPIIDYNKLQHDGAVNDILSLGNIEHRINSYGISTIRGDGHNFESINHCFTKSLKGAIIIFDTIKGYGYRELEGNPVWHNIKNIEEFRCIVSSINQEK